MDAMADGLQLNDFGSHTAGTDRHNYLHKKVCDDDLGSLFMVK